MESALNVKSPWIIPAYAGSTSRTARAHACRADHPRIRGEHPGVNRNGRGPAGSSPHTRGARVRPRCREALHGIIPAYAGSTTTGRLRLGPPRDHPRIRGEHWIVGRRGAC